MSAAIISGVLGIGTQLVEHLFPDPEEKQKAKLRLLELEQQGELAKLEAGAKAVVAEAESESWLAQSWRPITMLTFVAIIANNYLLFPYLSLFWGDAPKLEVPADLWDLIQIGLGGYVVSRGAEKVTREYKRRG